MKFSFSRATASIFSAWCVATLAVGCGDEAGPGSEPGGSGGVAAASGRGGGAGLGTGGAKAGSAGAAAGGSTSVAGSGGKAGSGTGGSATATGGAGTGGSSGVTGGSGGGATGGSGNAPGAGSGGGGGMLSMGGSGGMLAMGGEAGAAGEAGEDSGGRAGSGGSSAGAGSGGKSSGGSGNVPAIGPGPCGCETTAGEFGTVNATIVVNAGEVYDGACKIFRANPDTLGAGNQDEGQKPVFRVNDGGTLKNVVLGASAADGVHLHGDVTLENIHWLDIGEDAMTVKESGTVNLNCGSAAHAEDKIFQVNAASEIFISNFTASDGGKFMRQNGDTTFKVTVTIDHSDISDLDEVIFRTDSSSSHVTVKNTRYSNLGKGLFMFGDDVVNGNSGQSTVSNNQEY
jgi:hypothetical protein